MSARARATTCLAMFATGAACRMGPTILAGVPLMLPAIDLRCCLGRLEAASAPALLPRLNLEARPVLVEVDELQRMIDLTEATLRLDSKFTVLWDLRAMGRISRTSIGLARRWADQPEIIEALNVNVQTIVILVKSPVTKAIVRWVLGLCDPECPVHVTTDEQAALQLAGQDEVRSDVTRQATK
mmetsp:Transcript_33769/g.88860  ORF Transcript_33769/g.88860 Transcript_33769/m.88860 type:complete len:184 (+) Transcript_33769:27-578(+)